MCGGGEDERATLASLLVGSGLGSLLGLAGAGETTVVSATLTLTTEGSLRIME